MDTLTIIIIPVIVALIILVPVIVVAARNRGKNLKCPECGTIFKAPLMDNKRYSVGLTFPYTGTVKCPHCGNERSRGSFEKVEAKEKTVEPKS